MSSPNLSPTNHLKVGCGVSRLKEAEDTHIAVRIGCLGIDHLKAHFERVASLVTTNFQPDLIGRYAVVMPT